MSPLEANRTAKALKLADVLRAAGATAEDVEFLDHEGWQNAAAAAGVKPPSEQTKQATIAALRHPSRPMPSDDDLFRSAGSLS